MSLVNAINISLTFLNRELFYKIGLQVEAGERVGLVGPNGSGKTTLLKMITGEMLPDRGEIRIAKGTRIGYLPQDVHETLSGSILQSVLDSVPDRVRLRTEIGEAEQSHQGDLDEKIQLKSASRLARLHQEMGDLEREFPPHSAEKILEGLGFKDTDFDNDTSTLSGGWKTRAALSSLLYQNPDLLLLDEPTNHLDLPSIRWLEAFLQEYQGAIVMVCHDRDFLNRQIGRLISFEPEGLRSYSGNYDAYLKAREEEKQTLQAREKKQEQKIKEAKKFVERFRAKATKARQAQSKIKLIEKMELIKTHKTEKIIQFSFPAVSRSGGEVVSIEGVSKRFDGIPLYENLDLRVSRGERVAIIGPNGSGKTTLLRMVAGEIEPDKGRIATGHKVSMSYYAQHHSEMLDARKTIIEEVYQEVPHETLSFVRGVCGAFLFSGSDVDKPIDVLSGGERARVSLAKILVNPGNLLVMDEPTNHLDLISSEILIGALNDYEGTLFFVSHNQSFVNRLCTKIWDLTKEGVHEYPGTLYEYFDHLSRMEEGSSELKMQDLEQSPQKTISRKSMRKEKAENRRRIHERLKPIRDILADLERRVDSREKKNEELEKLLADPDIFKDNDKSVPLLSEYNENKKKLDVLLEKWEHRQQELESAKEELDALETD